MTARDDVVRTGPGGRRLVLTAASRIPLRAPRWLWDTADDLTAGAHTEGRIPVGSLTIAAGRAGVGKSQHAVKLAAEITRGVLPGCYYGRPRSVIYAATEDSWSMTIAPRLVAAGADLDRVFRIEVADDGDAHARLTLPTDTELLEQAIRDNDVALMILDPLLSVIDATVNDYRAREVRDALEPLMPIADRTGCALFGLAHFTKASGSDPLLLIAGSGAFGQIVRAAIGYAREDPDDDDPAETYVMSTIKSNLGREDLPSIAYRIEPAKIDADDGPAWTSRLVVIGDAERSVTDVLRDAHLDADDRSERGEAVKWLLDYLAGRGGQAPAGEAQKAAAADGIAKSTLTRARKRAGIVTTKGGMGTGWTWNLPDAVVDSPPRRTHEETEEPTHVGVNPSVSSVSPSDEPTRPCGHPGDPATRCGTCIAEKLNREPECAYCTRRALPGSRWCDSDDDAHRHARDLSGAAS